MRKKEMKLVLFADGMFEYMENLKKSILDYYYKELVNFKGSGIQIQSYRNQHVNGH